MKTIGVLSHADDLDGVVAGLLLSIWHSRLSGELCDINVQFSNYAEAEEKFLTLAEISDEIYVADLSWRNPDLLSQLKNPPKKIVFLDHHLSSIATFDHWMSNPPAGVEVEAYVQADGTKCASDLVWEKYFDSSELLRELTAIEVKALRYLVGITHNIDLWKRDKIMDFDLSDVIDQLGASKTFSILSKDLTRVYPEFFTDEITVAISAAKREIDKARAVALSSCVNRDFTLPDGRVSRLKVAFCLNAPSRIADDLGARTDLGWVVMLWLENGRISARTNEETIEATGVDVNDLMASFGGGGHRLASGGCTEPHLAANLEGFAAQVAERVNILLNR
jgi:oligoribonuclease NrnB/cAMP/cGMP phosphodiesterase (DHH superfamily)